MNMTFLQNQPIRFLKVTFITAATTLICGALAVGQTANPSASASSNNWKSVETAIGRSGQMQPGDVFKFGMPRKDLHVVLNGVEIKPALALGSWVAFKQENGRSMVMGDLVLTEEEVEKVKQFLKGGGTAKSKPAKAAPVAPQRPTEPARSTDRPAIAWRPSHCGPPPRSRSQSPGTRGRRTSRR